MVSPSRGVRSSRRCLPWAGRDYLSLPGDRHHPTLSNPARGSCSISSLFRKVSLLIGKSLMNFWCTEKKKKERKITLYYQCVHLKSSLHLCIVFSCKYLSQNVLAKNTILWFMVHVVSERNNCITNQWKQSKCSSWACTIKNWIKTIQAQKCKYAMFPISKKIIKKIN